MIKTAFHFLSQEILLKSNHVPRNIFVTYSFPVNSLHEKFCSNKKYLIISVPVTRNPFWYFLSIDGASRRHDSCHIKIWQPVCQRISISGSYEKSTSVNSCYYKYTSVPKQSFAVFLSWEYPVILVPVTRKSVYCI